MGMSRVRYCSWNPDHIMGSDNTDVMCSSCRKRYSDAVSELAHKNGQMREKGVPRQLGGQKEYLDFWVYECLNRLASPYTGGLHITADDIMPLVDRDTGEIVKSLNRLENEGKVSMERDSKKAMRWVYVYEVDDESEGIIA